MAAPLAGTPPAAAADSRGEQWWKDEARKLQTAVEDAATEAAQAGAAMQNSTLALTADEAEREYRARVAKLQNARAALERFRDDARRANVPPGWARWP
jgi:hypothetical protein